MKINRIAALALITTAAMNTQDLKTSEIPANFIEGLLRSYPNATDMEWEKNVTDYKVAFELGLISNN